MENMDIKEICKKNLKTSLLALVITIVTGLVFCNFLDLDVAKTSTVMGDILNNVNGDNPGGGYVIVFSLLVGGLLTFGELGMFFLALFLFFLIPVVLIGTVFFGNLIARLFQIGSNANWKTVISSVFLYLSLVVQLILVIFLISLIFTGFNFSYIWFYVMLAVNCYALIQNFKTVRQIKFN